MRELQKMSAAAIQSLPHAIPIKSGDETVGILMPFRKIPPDHLAKVLDKIADHCGAS